MAYKDLREFLARLEKEGLLCRVSDPVDWNLELGAVMRKVFDTGGPAILFENVKDSPYSLISGAMYTYKRYGLAIGCEGDLRSILHKTHQAVENPIPPVTVNGGPCQENVHTGKDINLYDLPVPHWSEADGGRFIGTLGVIVTRDPDTGKRNVGIYRQQLFSKNEIGLLATQHIGVIFQKYQAMGEPMPIATAIGVAPEVLAASVVQTPYGQDEFAVAGSFRGDPLPLVKCKTLDLEVPATAEIVLEGHVNPNPAEWKDEGPFGEFPGYYGGVKMPRPTILLSAVTHRHNPIFQGTLEGAPPNESSTIRTIGHTLGAWRKLNLMGVPGVKEVHMTDMGCANFWVVVSLERQYYGGNARQVMEGIWATMSNAKWVIVVDQDIDVFDRGQVEWALSTRVQPHRDIYITPPNEMGTQLDPSIDPVRRPYPRAQTSRIGIDATLQFKGFEFPAMSRPGDALMKTITEKWSGKGLF